MRNELHEPEVRRDRSNRRAARRDEALEPSAIDAALADETAPLLASPGSRRDVRHDAAQAAVDQPHEIALLRQLSQQLSLLETQQRQIRRLLEATERRGGHSADAC